MCDLATAEKVCSLARVERSLGVNLLLAALTALCLLSPKLTQAVTGDVDNDGIPDYIDVDDDNDGILDTAEGFTAVDQLINPSFEQYDPALAIQTFGTAPNRSFQFHQDDVPGWQNDAVDGAIEIWESNHNGSDPAPTPSHHGNAHSEINSTASVAQFQVINTVPGETLVWSVWHRGRRGIDVTQVKIGSASDSIATTPVIETMTTDRTAWAQFSGEYVVPAGQTNTRISFENMTTGNSLAAIGNFLDGLSFARISSVDTDGDGIPNHHDADSDADGIPDSTEGHDANGDGVADIVPSGNDTDGDGIDDSFDEDNQGVTAPEPDADGDSIPDYLDIDSDDDGITDSTEGTGDTDGDGTPDYLDTDSDDDGIPDSTEGFDADQNGFPDVTPSGADSDGDGLDNAFDLDVGGTPAPTQDTDGDGQADYIDIDSDDDGLSDEDEKGSDPAAPLDTDNNGTPDYLQVAAVPVPAPAVEDEGIIHTGLDRLACSSVSVQKGATDPLFVLLTMLSAGGVLWRRRARMYRQRQ